MPHRKKKAHSRHHEPVQDEGTSDSQPDEMLYAPQRPRAIASRFEQMHEEQALLAEETARLRAQNEQLLGDLQSVQLYAAQKLVRKRQLKQQLRQSMQRASKLAGGQVYLPSLGDTPVTVGYFYMHFHPGRTCSATLTLG